MTLTNKMTSNDFHVKMKEMEIPFNFHRAMSGSTYITVDGQQYRFSDHYQPSHYQIRNYIDVNSFEEIIEAVSHLEKEMKLKDFVEIYVNGGDYKGNKIEEVIHESAGLVYKNNFGLFGDKVSCARNLYYNLF